ncbi:MAG: ATP-binding cassette domain-containing protein [Planctomycetes bacterium]|nr:ATP-binding cassette domain-containing protein [Planctomycetota bacterium]
MAVAIRTERLAREYKGVSALGGVDVEVQEGEWVAVMGPSGSGKSTLLNVVAGLDRPTGGRVEVLGRDLGALDGARLAEFRRDHVGIVFQQFHLIPYLTALENVMLAQYFHSMTDEAEAKGMLDGVGLGDRAHHLPSQLSGGEQQRVCIARALVNHPRLLLADEPTGNLDERNERLVMDLFRELHRKGHTLVLVTHDLDIGKLAQRRVLLNHGAVVEPHMVFESIERYSDEVLEMLWKAGQDGDKSLHHVLSEIQGITPEMVSRMQELGLLEIRGDNLLFQERGKTHAREVVRRHRLAEKLFTDVFEVSREEMKAGACQFEHILSAEMTDSICSFLKHPATCPHGNPIPTGKCCSRGGAGPLPVGGAR